MSDWKAEVNALLEQAQQAHEATMPDLPVVIGDYRAVEGFPGWYMRKMKLRQQVQAMALYDQREVMSSQQVIESGITLGSLLLYRLELPQSEEAIRVRLDAWRAGTTPLFRPATADEVMDTFDQDELQDRVLTPMGFGIAEDASGNAESPTMPA